MRRGWVARAMGKDVKGGFNWRRALCALEAGPVRPLPTKVATKVAIKEATRVRTSGPAHG